MTSIEIRPGGKMRIGLFIDRWKLILPILLSWLLIVFGIFGHPKIIPFFVNSDTLQPAFMAWDMTRHAYAIPNFQWSRVPSLPDQAFFFLMELASVGWRTSFLIYTGLIATIAILSLGGIVARMRGSAYREGVFWAGIAVTLSLIFVMAVIAISPDQAVERIPQSILFMCNSHGDAFLISVIASLTTLAALRGSRRQAWATYFLCVLGTASDTIFIGYFLMPAALSMLIIQFKQWRAAKDGPNPALPSFQESARIVAWAGVACVIGWCVKYPLPMQAMRLEFHSLDETAGRLIGDLPHQPWVVALLALTLFLIVRTASAVRKPIGRSENPVLEVDREFLLLFGLGASLMSLGLAVVLFVDVGIYRYAMPFFWWPLAIGLGLLPAQPPRMLSGAVAALAALGTAVLPLSASALPAWRTPLEQCLSAHRSEWNLKAGLATYWHSRITMVSSDWTLQVDQIDDSGDAYLWGNNVAAYAHDMHAPHRPPEYNFIVVDDTVSQFDVETSYGPAPRVETCGDVPIWIYDQPITPPGVNYQPSGKLEVDFK